MKRITAGLATALLTLTVAGCSYPGNEGVEPIAAKTATPEPTSPSDAEPTEEPTPEGTEELDDLSATVTPAPSEKPEGELDSDADPIVLGEEGSTLYLRAIQAFSPELESWSVDLERGRVHYLRHTCIGSIEGEGYGSVAPNEDSVYADSWIVTWEGENPTEHSDSLTTWATITDAALTADVDVSSVHTDIEMREYREMCLGAGEMLIDFIL
ncbi:hypothetical protein [Leucobacter massiliensis]|uniref:Uncharacterized protein n=1 Tax=Leucobacter massiliensis TaxID=1686285 RepID=A0A2S9QLQ3_9MICO|nr:hypothetical protein [Leucobacter massiliensis]PRI10511.1 hypothetical protein B4915_10925 [Leucobacter massiliensis]